MNYRVLHVVRRFGPVGGMERYVWRLTSELLELGVEIDILCQSVECDVDPRINVHFIERSRHRRRWRAMLDFKSKCDDFWSNFDGKDRVIVHSHERCSFHHVTTFHGPPMPALSSLPWYRRMSNRIQFWSKVERCEVSGDDVVRVIPVSNRVRKQLILLYPEQEPRITAPLYPGLDKQVVKPRVLGESREHCGRILFVGREWKRKGLDKAIESISSLNKSDLKVTLDVYGTSASDVPKRFRLPWITFHGWTAQVPFGEYDLLIHPAREEPFGMIVPEALASGCKVLVSENVGAGEIISENLRSIEISQSSDNWASELEKFLREPLKGNSFEYNDWISVAKNHVGLYSGVQPSCR